MSKKLIVIGAGGHAQSVMDTIQAASKYKIAGIIEKQENINLLKSNFPVMEEDDGFHYFFKRHIKYAAIGIGSIGHVHVRRQIYLSGKKTGYEFPNIIDKSAVLAKDVIMGDANFIGKRAVLNAKVSLGNACIINTGAVIEHNSLLEDFVHAAPGCTILGNVKIGKNSHIGAGSVIMPNVSIGENVMIGAGSLVLKDIGNQFLAYGSPAREVGIWEK